MPSSSNYVRDYKQERNTAKKRGETGVGSKSGDAKRHRARRLKEKQLGRKLRSDEHVDHKTPVKSGGSNSTSNLRVRSRKLNTSSGGKIGNRKGKAAGGRKGKK
jgi:5-methylcytosine-specific restriction endonuclease McrA